LGSFKIILTIRIPRCQHIYIETMNIIIKDRNLLILFIVSFLFFFNEALLLPTLPLYLSDSNYTNLELGIVLGAFALGVLALRPFAGMLTDRKSRKQALIIGILIFFVSPVLYIISANFWYLIAVRFFHGIGISFFTTAWPTTVADIAPEDQRGEILGQMSIASTVSFAFGPLVGFSIYANFGITWVLVACTAAGSITLILGLFIGETFTGYVKKTAVPFRQVFFNRILLIVSATVLIHALIDGSLFTFLPIMLKNELGLNAGLYFTINAISMVIFRFYTSHLSDRFGRGPMFFYSTLVFLASVILIANIESMSGLVFAAALNGIGAAGFLPALTAFIVDTSDQKSRGSVFSIFYGAYDIGVLLAGMILGYFADFMGYSSMFYLAAVLGLLSLIFFTIFVQPGIRYSVRWTIKGKIFRS
jgi:MFS family permease